MLAPLMAVLIATGSVGETLRVPDQFAAVSDALAEATSGDRIVVAPGRYGAETGEDLPWRLAGRDVIIEGAGAGRTVLTGDRVSRLLEFSEGDRSVVRGFTLRDARAETAGGAVLVDGASPELLGLHFTANESAGGGDALLLRSGVPRVANCLFDRNGVQGPTVVVRAGSPILEHLTFHGNGGPALEVHDDASPFLHQSIICRPGARGGDAIGIRVVTGRGLGALMLEENLFSECFDGAVSIRGGSHPIVSDLRQDARSSGGMREGDPRFVDPGAGDFRLEDTSPARSFRGADAQLGAFGGRSPLLLDRSSAAANAGEALPRLLGPSVPNPFTPATTIHFTVEETGVVDLGVYNVLGQRIRTLHSGGLTEGDHSRVWDGRDELGADAPPGIYFVRVTQGEVTESRRVVLVR
ncbi:MAG: T9SS type A sorting domain-containing protein [Gemmatimonadetes bacterium]|nr:T9SS type A sorting domain-containing protein [Gemmatimonadota bacterium]